MKIIILDDIGKKDLINLVRNKKLVLLVDLDHTLIHTTNDNVSNQLKVCIFFRNLVDITKKLKVNLKNIFFYQERLPL